MENCWEPSPHSSQDYYPHYNLFQSSIFYDTDNFRVPCLLEDCVPSEGSENDEKSAEPPDKPPEPPEPLVKAKRVIAKQELYRDPDLFGRVDRQSNTNGPIEPPNLPLPQHWGYDWTKQSWVKEGNPMAEIKDERRTPEHQPVAPRVNNRKAESMMHKMGWQGGALGKTGDGITEPITPKAIYAFRPSPGPGQPGKKPGKTPVKTPPGKKNSSTRDVFRTNLLLHILEFVQDDTESELLLDTALRQHERRHVLSTVRSVVTDAALHSLSSAAQYDLARDIHKHNKYLLECAQGDNHQLGIYKEAPEEVYLVTPDDFLPKDDLDDETTANDKTNGDVTDVTTQPNGDKDDDENPFLKSIKKSIKKDDEPKLTNKFETDCVIAKSDKDGDNDKETPADKMLEFFLEFAKTETYKEMRFLGTFTDPQSSAINALLNDVSSWSLAGSFRGGEVVARALRAATFKIRDGANGTPEIHKVSTSQGRDLGNT